VDSELLQTIGSLGTAAATIALVFVLYKAIKQMESTVKLTQIQTEYQLRPWIGPSARFQRIEPSINDMVQFEVIVKNFGELPALGVDAKFVSSDKLIERGTIISAPETVFALGPMLPNMEKRYWFFIEKQRWENIESGKESLFTGVYFQYVANLKQNGYGIISQYVSSSQSFVHKDMWIDNPEST
jgi:hypothetical protein